MIEMNDFTLELIKRSGGVTSPDVQKLLLARSKKSKLVSHQYIVRMMNDLARNDFYRDIIKKHVPNKSILEVGAGAGLLSLLALKYGARLVNTCEHNELLYEPLDGLFARTLSNDQRLVLHKKSVFDLKKSNFRTKVDVLLHELFADDVFSEDFLLSVLFAKLFLKDTGRVVPGIVNVIARPVFAEGLKREPTIKPYDGFKFNELNETISRPRKYFWSKNMKIKSSEDAKVIFSLDLNKSKIPLEGQCGLRLPRKSRANVVLVYFELKDGQNRLCTGPDGQSTHWQTTFYVIDEKSKYIRFHYKLNSFWATFDS